MAGPLRLPPGSPPALRSVPGLPPPPHSPRRRRFSFCSLLKLLGDAPPGRSGRRAGRFQVPGPGLASAGLCPARRRELLPSCADSPRPEPGWGGPRPAGSRAHLRHAGPCAPSPAPRVCLPPTCSPAVSRAGPQRCRYLPRGLSILVLLHPHDPEPRQEESCSLIVFTVSFLSSGILWAPNRFKRTPLTQCPASPILRISPRLSNSPSPLHHLGPFPPPKPPSSRRTQELSTCNMRPGRCRQEEDLEGE